jgi:uroporphyrinogen decarboxylase
MNGKERCLAVIGGKQPDRIPVFPLLMFLAADRLGVPYKEYATDGSVMAQAQFLMTEMFDVDAVTGWS